MRAFIETHFSLVMILACAAGLFLPGLPALPNATAVFALGILTFISCYRLRDGGKIDVKNLTVFFALRYVVLPVILWHIAKAVVPDYAVGVFLLSLVPAGVASPAFASMYGGAVAPAFAMVMASQLLAPLLIPLQFAWLGGNQPVPSPAHMFTTLVWCILVPMGVYALFRKRKKSADYFYERGKLFSILLVAFIIAFAVSKQRDVILADPAGLITPLLVTLCCYWIYIVFGWVFASRFVRQERIALATCSGFNNAALSVSLALMHFGPEVILFVAVSEISWSLLPLMMKGFLRFFAR